MAVITEKQQAVLAANIAANPSTNEIWSQVVAEANRLGLGNNGDSKYTSQGGSRYLKVGKIRGGDRDNWNYDFTIRVGNHGGNCSCGPNEIALTTTQSPAELQANLATAFARMAALMGAE